MAAEKTEKKTHKKTQEKSKAKPKESPKKGAGRATRRGPKGSEERRPEPVQLPETKNGPHPGTPPQPAD